MNKMVDWYQQAFSRLSGLFTPTDGVLFFVRAYMADVFYASAKTKMSGFLELNDFTVDLFYNEYGFPLIEYACSEAVDEYGDAYDQCSEVFSAETAAYLTMYAEVFFPLMLMLGLLTRVGAIGLLGMTLFIQFYVYPAQFHGHLIWFAGLLLIAVSGPGKLSLDRLLGTSIKRHAA